MTTRKTITEAAAIAAVEAALSGLNDADACVRVLDWANAKFGALRTSNSPRQPLRQEEEAPEAALHSAGAIWLRRNGLDLGRLNSVLSVDQPELDLIAAEVPGDSMRSRMRNVLLLRGACSYLKTGEFRFDDASARETCRHYNAFDRPNFTTHLKSFGDEINGSKENGYSLSAKGQKAAIELLKAMVSL